MKYGFQQNWDGYKKMLTEAYGHLVSNDDVLSPIVRRNGVIDFTPDPDIFTNVCESIICQQLSSRAADAILKRVYEMMPGRELLPQVILNTNMEEFRRCGVSSRKIEYVREFSEKILSRKIDLEKIWELDDDGVIEILTLSRGIGTWTAKMVLIFSMGRPDVLAYEDQGIRAAVRDIYGTLDIPDTEQIKAIAESWRPYCSIASMYLWKYRDGKVK